MANFLSKIFSGKETSVIGIDIGTSSIKVVQLKKKKGRAVLETYGEIALGPYAGVSIGQSTNLTTDKISEALLDVLREANTSTINCGIAIPFRSSLVSLIEMPNLSDKKLQEMIPIEARKYIPVPISEVTLDWWIVPKENSHPEYIDEDPTKHEDPKNKTDVLVVSIHNEVLSSYNDIVKKSALNASFFEIEMFSSTRALIDTENSASMIFDMGASGTKLYIIDRGVIRNSHIVNKGSQDITIALSKGLSLSIEKAENVKRNLDRLKPEDKKTVDEIVSLTLDYIFSEANNVLLAYQRKYNKAIGKVILTGGGTAIKGFIELAKKNFQTNVVLGEPFLKTETPAFLQEALKQTGLEFAVAVGIALRKLQEVA